MAKTIEQISIAFINDKSPIINIINNNLLGINVPFRSENIDDVLSQFSALAELPQVCIIDLDFWDSNVLAQLHELKIKYPTLKLIAHSDDYSEQIVITLLEIGIDGYLLIGNNAEELQTAIEGVCNDKKYFSTGLSKIASEYLSNKAKV